MSAKFTLITPFFEWHGIGFLDLVLQALNDTYKTELRLPKVSKTFEPYELHKAFSQDGTLKSLEKVVYLLPWDYEDHIGKSPRWREFSSQEKLKIIRESIEITSQHYQESIEDLKKLVCYLSQNEQFPDYNWLKKNWRHQLDLWHIINDFSIKTQIDWYKDHSPVYQKNKNIEFIKLDINYEDLHDEYLAAHSVRNWLTNTTIDNDTYINLWGTRTCLQFAFHYLSWSSPRLKPAQFIKCINEKSSGHKTRFTPIKIELAAKNLLSNLRAEDEKLSGLSSRQKDIFKWLSKYREIGDNFTILLLGSKGTGKTKVVEDVYSDKKDHVISVNCAQFQSNPDFARSELFGHIKGAFTGAKEEKIGAFTQANKKVLFLDEIHHLDRATQSMLLTALQTDRDGYFKYTPLGSDKPKQAKFQLIVASNIKSELLAEKIYPDLLDRISQRKLEFSDIEPGLSVKEKFNSIWSQMDFKGANNPLSDNVEFENWLTAKKRVFAGNYRDLQKIAILCADYERCKELISDKTTLIGYIEADWNKHKTSKSEISVENFFNKHNQLSIEEMTNEFRAKVVRAAEHYTGDSKSAAKMLGITPKSIIAIKKRYSK